MRYWSTKNSIVGTAVFACLPVLAQQTPPAALDPGQLLRQEQIKRLPDEPASDIQAPFTRPQTNSVAVSQGGPSVEVKGFQFQGLTSLTEDEAQQILSPAIGQSLTFGQLRDLGTALAAEMARRGFFLAQVLLPAQDVTDGLITFKVVEGRLSANSSGIQVTGDSQTNADKVRSILRTAVGDGPVQEKNLERGVLLLNDLPGVGASVTLQPGDQDDSTSLNVVLRDLPLMRGSFSLDTFGNRYTGSIRAGLNLAIENATGLGDQASAAFVKAIDGDSEFARVGYSLPVGNRGVQLGVNASRLDYVVGKELSNLNTTGSADILGVFSRYSFIRTRETNLYGNVGYEDRHLKSEALGASLTDKRLKVLTFGLSGDRLDQLNGGGITSGNVAMDFGRLNLDALPAVKAADASATGLNTQGGFKRMNYGVTRLQTLSANTILQLSISGQASDRNLDTSDKLSLGGALGVRAYPAGEGLGDQGFVATGEIRTVLAKKVRMNGLSIGDVQLAAFYDEGHIQQFKKPLATLNTPNQYGLAGAGFGLNIGDAGVYDLRLIVARKLGSNPGLQSNGRDSDGGQNLGRIAVLLNIYF